MTDTPTKPHASAINAHATIADLKAKKERQKPYARTDMVETAEPAAAAAPPRETEENPAPAQKPKVPRPDRAGKKLIAGYFPAETKRALKHISVDEA